jgi:hypothetical protein
MALNLPNLQQPVTYFDNKGRYTPPYRRFQREFKTAIEDNAADVENQILDIQAAQDTADDALGLAQDAITDLIGQQSDIDALTTWQTNTILDLIAITNDLDTTVTYLSDLTDWIIYFIGVIDSYMSIQVEQRIRQYIQNSIRGTFRGHGFVAATTSTGPDGYIYISHGKGATPDTGTPKVSIRGTSPYCATVTAYDSTTITVFVWNPTTGVGVPGVGLGIDWDAWFWDGYPAFGPPGVWVVDDPPTPP